MNLVLKLLKKRIKKEEFIGYLFKEVFRIVELGSQFTMTLAGPESTKISEADKVPTF